MVWGVYYMYNIKLFGKYIKSLREGLNLTRKDLSEMSGVHIDTLRNIEISDKSLPRNITLEKLSFYLKEDLNEILLKYRLDDFSLYNNIKNQIESKLENNLFDIDKEIKELEEIMVNNENEYFNLLINQLIYFLIGIREFRNKNYQRAYEKFLESIKMTSINFNIYNYKEFHFSKLELRLLMNIALTLNRLHNKKIYLSLMEFCVEQEDLDIILFMKISNNLSVAYSRNKDYNKAYNIINKGIQKAINHKTIDFIHCLYYQKGLVEHKLNNKDYIKSIS